MKAEETFQYVASGDIGTAKRNPYDPDTPEHHLWEQAKAEECSAMSHEAQSRNHAQWAANAHLRADKYRKALNKLVEEQPPK